MFVTLRHVSEGKGQSRDFSPSHGAHVSVTLAVITQRIFCQPVSGSLQLLPQLLCVTESQREEPCWQPFNGEMTVCLNLRVHFTVLCSAAEED